MKFGVLLPEHPVDRTMHPCTTLPIAMAEEWLIAEDLTPFSWVVDGRAASRTRGRTTSDSAISVQFEYRNSMCSDVYGPIHAMEIYYRGPGRCRADEDFKSRSTERLEIQAFYGPCCKYALSPVGRYAQVWNVPVITPGGLTSRFNSEVDFIMLTRFIPPFEKVAEFVSSLLAKYGWWHLSFLFHDNIGRDKWKGYPMCFDLTEAVGKYIKARDKRTPQSAIDNTKVNRTTGDNGEQEDKCCVVHREIFNENYYDESHWDAIMASIRNASRGK